MVLLTDTSVEILFAPVVSPKSKTSDTLLGIKEKRGRAFAAAKSGDAAALWQRPRALVQAVKSS